MIEEAPFLPGEGNPIPGIPANERRAAEEVGGWALDPSRCSEELCNLSSPLFGNPSGAWRFWRCGLSSRVVHFKSDVGDRSRRVRSSRLSSTT